MAELPLDQAIPRFKTNEDRIDTFVNGDENATYTTSGGVPVPSVRKVVADITALHDGSEVDTFADLVTVAPTILPMGDLIRVIETGAVYERVSTGCDLDYTGAGGVRLLIKSGGRMVTPEHCGARGGSSDDTDAMQLWADVVANDRDFRGGQALGVYNISAPLVLASGYPGYAPYYPGTTDVMPERTTYDFVRGSRIRLAQTNERGVILRGRGIDVGDLEIEYITPQGSSETNSWGLALQGFSFGKIRSAKILRAAKAGVDLNWAPTADPDNTCFENHFGPIWHAYYGLIGWVAGVPAGFTSGSTYAGGIYLDGRFATGASGTSALLEQTGAAVRCRTDAQYALLLNRAAGDRFSRVNIERAFAGTNGLIRANEATGVQIGTLHLEGVAAGANYAAMIRANSAGVRIDTLDAVDINLGDAYTLGSDTVGVSAVGARMLSVDRYTSGYAEGYIDIGRARWGGKFRATASAVVARSQIPNAINIDGWSDETVSLDGSPWDWAAPPNLTAGVINSDGTPKTEISAYSGGPALFIPLRSWKGRPIRPYAKAAGGGGTQTTTGIITLNDVSDRWGLHSGGVFTIPEPGLYEVRWLLKCQYSGNAAVELRVNGATVADSYTMTSASGVVSEAQLVPRAVRLTLARGDTVGLYLTSGGVAKGADSWVEIVGLLQ